MSEMESAFTNDAGDAAAVPSSDVTAAKQSNFRSKKRPPASDVEVYQRKIKRIRERLQCGSPIESNAVMVLNEYDKDLKYEVVGQIGPVHSPSFTIQLVVNGQVFTGISSSKKKAKLQAAESAVHALLGEPPDVVASTPSGAQMKLDADTEESSCRGVNPTVVLNQLRPGTTYSAVVPDDPAETLVSNGKPVYGMVCVVDGERFEGCGPNKKITKALAADAALRKLFGIQCSQLPDGSPVFTGDMSSLTPVKRKLPAGTRAGATRPVVSAPNLLVDLPGGKNPVSLLHELYSLSTELTIEDLISETPGVFVANVRIENQDFQGQGTNKKAARIAAATAAVNYLHESGLLTMKLTAKEIKRRQQTPWQPRQRPQFSQTSEQTGTMSGPGQARGRGRGRGRGRVLVRNQPWVSGGVLKANDFLGLQSTAAQDRSQFSADEDYMQLAESARNFAAAAGTTHGYEAYSDPGQAYAQQGQKRGAVNSSSSGFTAYGGYVASTGASQAWTPNPTASRGGGRGRGFGVKRGSGVTQSAAKPLFSAVDSSTTYRPKYGGSGDMGYGMATTPQLMQSTSQPVAAEQYATAVAADSYTSVGGQQQQQQQQLYEAYPGYEYADTSAAYSQAAYYTTTGGQYLTTDAGVTQYYSQF